MLIPMLAVTIMQDDFKFSQHDMVVTTPSSLQYADTAEGRGDAIKSGQMAIVNYVLHLDDGKEVDSSKQPGRNPFRFTVGKSEVIKGWDEGLVGMKVGGTRKLRVPYQLAYGERGIEGAIPEKATLWFTVDLLAITDVASFSPNEKPEKNPSGLQYFDLLSPKGQAVKSGDKVVVHYTLFNEKQEKLDSSTGRGRAPMECTLGEKGVIKGFQEGVIGMKPGGLRKIRVPAELGYGAEGNGPVKPNETLWFIIELLEIKKP